MRTTSIPIVVALVLALCACGGSEEQEPASEAEALQERLERLEVEAKKREAEAASKVKAAERRAEAAQRKARAARREAKRKQAQAQEKAAEPDAAATAAESNGDIVVPDVTGLDHQAAQDAMQGEGLWLLDEEDCTGQGRILLFDRNWEVVSTDPPAGTRVSEDTPITICSKKQDE